MRIPSTFRTDDRELKSLLWHLGEPLANRVLYDFSDYQTEQRHFLGIVKDEATTVFINVSEDLKGVTLDWVDFDGDEGIQ